MATNSVSDNPASSVFAALNGSSGSTATSKTADAQNRFLLLLTTQLKNQDPLNPVDNAQMTSQLAQISTVDGIERLNSTLQSLITGSTESQTMQAAAMVGHGVMVPGSGLGLKNGIAIAGVDLAGAVDQVTVSIKDGNGQVVRTLQLGAKKAGFNAFQWDGKADSGEPAADGNYSFSVEAKQGGAKVDATAIAVGLVNSVSRTASGLSLNVNGLGAFSMSDVRQIL